MSGVSWVLSSKTVMQESCRCGVGCVSVAEEDISYPVLN